ncbi:MAG: IS110 family transposase [Rhodobiaceae bacterium]|nr:IS110 family transposase [Rhodobiaceae bacterium]
MGRIFVGIDVAKEIHWACAIDQSGEILLDRSVKNMPDAIDSLIEALQALEGDLVIGLDIVGSYALFLESMLLAAGFVLVHAPGIAVNRASQGFAGGERKSDPRDAFTIADLVRTRKLRRILPDDDTVVALRLKVGRRRELVQEQTRRFSRLRQLLCGIHPGLERVLNVSCKGALVLLERYVTPAEIRKAGKSRLIAHLRKTPHLRSTERLSEAALKASAAQKIAVPGESATAEMIRELAREALDVVAKLARIDRDLKVLLEYHPDGALIRSLPGMGSTLTAEFIASVGDVGRFQSADALASAAGLAPVMRQSGKSNGWRRARGGDSVLKRVFYQSAFCAVTSRDPLSKAYYDRKRSEGKHHTQALIALARRRVNVVWAMLQKREPFDPGRIVA